jgi:arylsulfatase B/arylsulfatase I/J
MPMFLYYAMQLIHFPLDAPEKYVQRCMDYTITNPSYFDENDELLADHLNYCGMNIMLDEAIANLTCTLKQYGMDENLVLVISSDNGGEVSVPQNSEPFRGMRISSVIMTNVKRL